MNKFLFTKLLLLEAWLTMENTGRRAQVFAKYFGCTSDKTVQKDHAMYHEELCLQNRKSVRKRAALTWPNKAYAPRKTADETWHIEALATMLTSVI